MAQMDRGPTLPSNVSTALDELRDALGHLYGNDLQGLYLYGSYARGTQSPDSDVDVLVVLTDRFTPSHEIARMGEIVSTISLKYSMLISATPVSSDWSRSQWNPFFRHLQKEAIPL